MHSLTPLEPNPALVAYLEKPLIKSIAFNGFKYSYSVNGHTLYTGGIHSKIKSIYYPDFEIKLRQYRRKGKGNKKKGSTKKQGILIDKELAAYVKSGKKKKPRNMLSKAVVSYIEDHCKSSIQAAQVPVFIKQFGVVTQADLIIQTPKGELMMLELKSGYNSARAQGTIHGVPDVANTIKNHWEIQRHYTEKGLIEGGLPIKGSYIINVYQEDKGATVKKRKNPDWVKQLK